MKQIKLIIMKRLGCESFFIQLQGHRPNPNFKSVVATGMLSYEEAYRTVLSLQSVIHLIGGETACYNEDLAEKAGRDYCHSMAFEPLDTIRE